MTNKEVIFNNLSFGDLILAKRSEDTRKIEKGHRNGPFLVLGKNNENLIGLYATSNENRESLIKISKNNYNLHKDTYITSSVRTISIGEFLSSIYYLNDKEKKNILKFLYINGLEKYALVEEPGLEIGDIIQSKQKHLIIGENDANYITIKVEYDDSDEVYEFDYKHKNEISKNKKYKRVAFLSDEQTKKCIAESKKNYSSKKHGKLNIKPTEKINSPLQIGNLIVYEKLFYYLYYELGNKKLSFAVSKNKSHVSQKIIIAGDIYYANFGLKKDFDENQENIVFVATATEEEKQMIKILRTKK